MPAARMPDAGWWRGATDACGSLARRHGWQLALLFAGVLLPMWAFMELADEVHEAVVPFDVALVLALLASRRWREGLFAAIATGGSALLNIGAKRLFARDRPGLWESIAPETSYSFPSGHAMGSMTLALTLVLLTWRTRARWWVVAAMAVFVPMVGLSRVYLGVHYPSDILAGWAAASAWVVGAWLLVMRNGTAARAGG